MYTITPRQKCWDKVTNILCTVHCTEHCTVYTVQCSVKCTVYSVQCTVYSVHCALLSYTTAVRFLYSKQGVYNNLMNDVEVTNVVVDKS